MGLILSALSLGVVVGIVFRFSFPTIPITTDLGLLIALLSLGLAWAIQKMCHGKRAKSKMK